MSKLKTITKEELERIYRENTLAVACKILKISKGTLNKYLNLYGIPKKGRGRNLKIKVIV